MNKTFYIYQNRIFLAQQSVQPSLGDINNDGVVDILDAGDVSAFQLEDFNNDGVIDILDAAEYNSNPDGIVIPPTVEEPDTLSLEEIFNFDPNNNIISPTRIVQYCSDGPEFSFVTGSIITTGCNSITNTDGTINWPAGFPGWENGQGPWFCPEGQIKGLTIDPETGNLIFQRKCTCVDSSVTATQVIAALPFLGGPWKKGAKTAVEGSIAFAKQNIDGAKKYRKFLQQYYDEIIKSSKDQLTKEIASTKRKLEKLQEIMRRGINPDTGKPLTQAEINKILSVRNIFLRQINMSQGLLDSDLKNLANLEKTMKFYDDLIAKFDDEVKILLEATKDLDHFDPAYWANLYIGALIPLSQFFTTKICGWPKVLNDECECVDPGSGSGTE